MDQKLKELKILHDAGFSLIWLHPKEKRPIGKGWTEGPRLSWKQLLAEYKPNYNVGVRLGESSKLAGGYLCCIDVDIHDEKYRKVALAKLKEVIGNGKYAEVRSGSGSGSRHLYAVSKEPFKMVEIEKHKGQWEICAYSTGRQMVLPPSIHPSGKSYEWKRQVSFGEYPTFRSVAQGTDRRNEKISRRQDSDPHSFQAKEVDLSRLDHDTISLIEDGTSEDRSAALLKIAMKMCRAKYTDDDILSTLSSDSHAIAEAAYDHTGSRDRRKAVEWLRKYTLLKARHETHVMRLFDNKPDFAEAIPLKKEKLEEIVSEMDETFPDVEKSGKPKTTLRNVVHALEKFLGGAVVGFNEFSCRPYFLLDTAYGGKKGIEVADTHDLALKHHLSCHYGFEPSKELCFEAHSIIAQKQRFHPVKKYLETLTWDGVLRLDQWLVDAFRAVGPHEYLQAVGRKVLVAAVARIYEPGCKFDHMAVLEGNQGEGKSMSLGMLVGPQWFTDSLGDIHNKDVVDQMIGKWMVEVSELDSIKGREAEAVKAFVSRQVDRVRLSYARRAEDFPRQCIFIGSTNDKEYLTDETGNRRYWPIQVGLARRKWLRENRDQLWAEAKFRYELGEKLYLSKELEQVAKGEQEKRFEVDEWEGELKQITTSQEEPFITTELWRVLNAGMANGHPSMYDTKRIGKIMRRLGFIRSTQRVDKSLPIKCWVAK